MLEILVGTVLIYGGPAIYLWLQVRALMDSRGPWLYAAMVPAAAMAVAVVMMVIAFAQGSNLAPLGVIFIAPLCIGWLLLLSSLRNRRSV